MNLYNTKRNHQSSGASKMAHGKLFRTWVFIAATGIDPASADIYFNAKVLGPVTNIFVAKDDGKIEKITENDSWRDLDTFITPAGDIFFTSNREEERKIDMGRMSEDFNIYRINNRSKKVEKLTSSAGHEVKPEVSPNGKKVVFIRSEGQHRHLVLANADGKKEKQLTDSDDILGFTWLPDSKHIIVSELEGERALLKQHDLASGKSTVLRTANQQSKHSESNKKNSKVKYDYNNAFITGPRISPSGDKLAYIVHPFQQGQARQLYVMDLNKPTAADTLVSVPGAQVQEPVTWSKDNNQLLYSALMGYRFYYNEKTHKKVYEGGMHIFISDLEGNHRQLTSGDHLHQNPVFSPDEKSIAYFYSDQLGDARKYALRTMTVDGQGVKEIYNSVAKKSSLAWR